jgi:hypothetical protein
LKRLIARSRKSAPRAPLVGLFETDSIDTCRLQFAARRL